MVRQWAIIVPSWFAIYNRTTKYKGLIQRQRRDTRQYTEYKTQFILVPSHICELVIYCRCTQSNK